MLQKYHDHNVNKKNSVNFWSHYISVAFYFILFVIIFNLPANFTTTK